MLLSWKNLGYIAALDSLVTWAKNETSAATRRRKVLESELILGNRHIVKVANIAREAAHSKKY